MSPTRSYHHWSEDMNETLRQLYPIAKWAEINTAFPGIDRRTLYQRAQQLGLRRWNVGEAVTGEILTDEASPVDIGWLAGFLDGEGSLQLFRKHRSKNGARTGTIYLSPTVQVVNTDRGAMEKAHRLMGGHWGTVRVKRAAGDPLTCWIVRITGIVRCERLLAVLLPHLTCKRPRAELLLEYATVRKSRSGRSAYGEKEASIYRAFYAGSGRNGAARTYRTYANPELSPEETLVNV